MPDNEPTRWRHDFRHYQQAVAGRWIVPDRTKSYADFAVRDYYVPAAGGGRRRLASLSSDLTLSQKVNAWVRRTGADLFYATAPEYSVFSEVATAAVAAAEPDVPAGTIMTVEVVSVSVLYYEAIAYPAAADEAKKENDE